MLSNCSMKPIAASDMRVAAVWIGLVVFAGMGFAHDVSRSDSRVEIQGREVRVTLTLNVKELQGSATPFEAVRQHYFVSSPAAPVGTALEKYSALAGSLIQLRILYTFAQDVSTLNVKSTLYEVMP